MVDYVTVAADDGNLHAGYGQHFTRMRDHVLVFSRGQHLLVSGVDFLRRATRLGVDVGSVIDEGAYRDLVNQLGHAAAMVIVIMRQQDVVDLVDARTPGCRENPVRIPALVVWPACV